MKYLKQETRQFPRCMMDTGTQAAIRQTIERE